MAKPHAKLSNTKNDQGFFIVETRSIADEDMAAEHGLVPMPKGGPGWWYDDSDGTFRPPVPEVAKRKSSLKTSVDNQYQKALKHGVTWNGTRWTATDAGRDTLIELHEVAQQDGISVTVLDANGIAHTLSAADLDSLRAAGRSYRQQARENRLALHQQIAAAASHAELDAIDPTTG